MKTRRSTNRKKITRRVRPGNRGGSYYKKIRDAKIAAAAEAGGFKPSTVVLPAIVNLSTVQHWHDQIADLFRRARIGDIEKADASRLCYLASEGAKLCGKLQELHELESLRQQLAAIQGGAAIPHQQLIPMERET
jgi:hypothetical protein